MVLLAEAHALADDLKNVKFLNGQSRSCVQSSR
jgi:hypothetical protein